MGDMICVRMERFTPSNIGNHTARCGLPKFHTGATFCPLFRTAGYGDGYATDNAGSGTGAAIGRRHPPRNGTKELPQARYWPAAAPAARWRNPILHGRCTDIGDSLRQMRKVPAADGHLIPGAGGHARAPVWATGPIKVGHGMPVMRSIAWAFGFEVPLSPRRIRLIWVRFRPTSSASLASSQPLSFIHEAKVLMSGNVHVVHN